MSRVRADLPKLDAARRIARKGVALSILEQSEKSHDEASHYFDTHEIATEFQQTYGRRKLERWAREQNPTTGTGLKCFSVGGGTARWP